MRPKARELLSDLLLFFVLAGVLAYFCSRFEVLKKGTDFVHLYSAARMVREGQAHQLYNLDLQERFEARYGGRVGTYFIHPPFEALIYLPFALFSLSRAYLLWSAFNLGLLVAVAKLMQRHFLPDWDWRVQGLLFLLYVPVLVNFLLGQDSVLLLLFVVCALAALKSGREFAAGCWLACGLFKFQLSLPLAIVLLPGRTKRFSMAFVAVAALLVGVSVAVSGWSALWLYPRLLLRVNGLPLATVHPREQMADVRGLVSLFPLSAPVAFGWTIAASLLILGSAIGLSRRETGSVQPNIDLQQAQAVVAACLMAYHLLPHDLSLLLLPLAVIARYLRAWTDMAFARRISLGVLAAAIFLPPAHLLLLSWHLYSYMGILVVMLFAWIALEIVRPARAVPQDR